VRPEGARSAQGNRARSGEGVEGCAEPRLGSLRRGSCVRDCEVSPSRGRSSERLEESLQHLTHQPPEHIALKLTRHTSRAIFDRYDIVSQRELSGGGSGLVVRLVFKTSWGSNELR